MFKCAVTERFSKPGEKPYRLVVERRQKEYMGPNPKSEDGESIVIGRGWEIVKEIDVTMEGLKRWSNEHPDDLVASEAYVRLVKAEQARKTLALRTRTTDG